MTELKENFELDFDNTENTEYIEFETERIKKEVSELLNDLF